MTTPIFAAAQCSVRAGDITENIRRHLVFMDVARQHGVQFLLFPELSLTGYEPTLADRLAQKVDTPLIAPLREYAREAGITAVVGLPLQSEDKRKPSVSALVLHADGRLTAHAKQHLHTGEEQYFSAGHGGDLLEISGIPLALSICADFSQATHAARASRAGAQLYAASVLVGDAGYGADSATLKSYAKEHRMAVLMANHGGPTGGWCAAGRSAFWDENGELVAATAGVGDQLLIASKRNDVWTGSTVTVGISG
jgi:predicted amidohydrolase